MTITPTEYYTEVESLAQSIVEEAMEQSDNDRADAEDAINDHILHETIDGHQWIIYNAYNLDVIQHSDNQDYASDNFGSEYLAAEIEAGGLDRVHTIVAFWCLHADVCDKLSAALDEAEAAIEETSETE